MIARNTDTATQLNYLIDIVGKLQAGQERLMEKVDKNTNQTARNTDNDTQIKYIIDVVDKLQAGQETIEEKVDKNTNQITSLAVDVNVGINTHKATVDELIHKNTENVVVKETTTKKITRPLYFKNIYCDPVTRMKYMNIFYNENMIKEISELPVVIKHKTTADRDKKIATEIYNKYVKTNVKLSEAFEKEYLKNN